MLTIQTTSRRAVAEVRALPAASRLGLAVMVLAGLMDVIVHVAGTDAHAAHHGFPLEHAAHLLGVVGMVLTLAGVLIHGARRQLKGRAGAAINGGLDANAPR
jgi:hypothetical protein